jgi:hypothetical protein
MNNSPARPGEAATEQATAGGEPPVVAAGRAIVMAAAARSIAVRLLGGVAIWIRGSAAARAALGRSYPDIDLVAHKRQSRALRALLEEQGFQPERVFNATHGARRLLYHLPPGGLLAGSGPGGSHVDVFLDIFEMSHTLDLGARLEAEPETLAAAELLLTKLQIAEVNRKDLSDVAMLLWDHEPANGDGEGKLSLPPMATACGADWGLYTTVTENLAACAGLLGELVPAQRDRDRIHARIERITEALEAAPKTVGWRMRARIGRRVRWYQLPEEVIR